MTFIDIIFVILCVFFFFFKQKTAYEMRISDWSSDVCSSDLLGADMKAGTVIETGRDLDVAVQGDALLVVQAKDGGEAYTRRGDLQLSPSGLLTTGDGSPVQGGPGPVTIHPADSTSRAAEARGWVGPAGGEPHHTPAGPP